MFRSIRPGVLLALIIAVACTDQPTEPTIAVEGAALSMALPPVPAPPTPLFGSMPGADGAPLTIQLGYWEAPTLARVTVTGLLHYSGSTGGYLPGAGFIDAKGIYVPSGNSCALQLSVRIAGFGPIGGSYASCPSTINQNGVPPHITVVSGQVYAQRIAGPPGSCYTGGLGCTSISGTETITVEPLEGAGLGITSNATKVAPGTAIAVVVAPDPAKLEGVTVPWTFREFRWEGQGPIVGGGQPKGCYAQPAVGTCFVVIYQSGYVVGEAIVNGQLKTQKIWVTVSGGDSLPPPPPPPPDSIPPDSIPSDSIPGGGGDGGGGCTSAVRGLMTASLADSACNSDNDSLVVITSIDVSRTALLPVLSPCFDAKTQVAKTWHCAANDLRTDTVQVHVKATYSGRAPAGGVTLLLKSSYSHIGNEHTHRPGWGEDSLISGRFIPLGGSTSGPVGDAELRVVLGSSGDTTVVFRTAGVSGDEGLSVEVDTTSLAPGTGKLVLNSQTTVGVRWNGLEELTADESVHLIGETDEHPSNHWATPQMNALLREIADSVAALGARMSALPPSKRPFGAYPLKLSVNDMGLEHGGLVDIDTQTATRAWSEPHLTHRDGQHADVDIRRDSSYDALSDYVMIIWQDTKHLKFVDERDSKNHVHLANQPLGSTAPAGAPARTLVVSAAICATLACGSPPAAAEVGPLSQDTVSVTIDSVWRHEDKVAISYHVVLGPDWRGQMVSFLVQPGLPLQSLSSSTPDHWLDRRATYDDRNVIEWTALAREDRPSTGSAVGGFVVEARAIVGSIPFLVERHERAVLTSEDQLGDSVKVTPLWERGSTGTILGPLAPLPATSAGRAGQLASDVKDWCDGAPATPRGICESLTRKADEVVNAAKGTGHQSLNASVRVFRAELDAQRDVHIPAAVYWRLVADAIMVAP